MIFTTPEGWRYNEKGFDLSTKCTDYIKSFADENGVDDLNDDEFLCRIDEVVMNLIKESYHLYQVISKHENTEIGEIYSPQYYTEAFGIFASEVTCWAASTRIKRRVKNRKISRGEI